MKIKILLQKYNPLLKRKEIVFEVDHTQEGQTSPRLEVRKGLANMLKTDLSNVFVEKLETKTGMMTATGVANAYESAEQAKVVESEHIIVRNTLHEKRAEVEGPKTAKTKEDQAAKEEKLEDTESKKDVKEATSSLKPEDPKEKEEKKEEP